jgi:hypothetical protein
MAGKGVMMVGEEYMTVHKPCGTRLRRRCAVVGSVVKCIMYCPKCKIDLFSVEFEFKDNKEWIKFAFSEEKRSKMIEDALTGNRKSVIKKLDEVL